MQYIDGKLYPPMNAVVNGKLEGGSELGKWQKATEHPEKITWENGKAYVNLSKGLGKGSVSHVEYAPYEHSSNLVLNDQFEGAWNRPNLVTVECIVPKSELTGAYHAQYAPKATGWHRWHSGP